MMRMATNHASYIQSWIKVLKDDPQKLFDASYQSQQAMEYIEKNGIESS